MKLQIVFVIIKLALYLFWLCLGLYSFFKFFGANKAQNTHEMIYYGILTIMFYLFCVEQSSYKKESK